MNLRLAITESISSAPAARLALLLIAVLCGASAREAACAPENARDAVSPAVVAEDADSLAGEVAKARSRDDYGRALTLSRRLLARRLADPSTPPHEILEADWLAKTFERITGLSAADRSRFTRLENGRDERMAGPLRVFKDPTPSFWEGRLRMARELFGARHPEVVAALTDLGGYYFENGRYEAAVGPWREAAEMSLVLYPRQYPEVASNINNLGAAYYYLGDLRAAEPLLIEALSIMRATRGPDSPATLDLLNNLGSLYSALGDVVAAERCFDELRGVCVANGLRLSNAGYLRNHALVLRAKGDLEGAERLIRRAIFEQDSLHCSFGQDYALHFHTLGILGKERGEYATADSLSRRAVQILSRELRGAHPFMPRLYQGLASIHLEQGDVTGAIGFWQEAMTRSLRIRAPGHPEVVRSLTSLGEARLALGPEGLDDAERDLATAARRFDTARLLVGASARRATQRLASPYPPLAAVQLLKGEGESAWASLERSLGRTLTDLLLAADERDLTEAEAAREDSLKGLLSRLESEVEGLRQATEEAKGPDPDVRMRFDDAWTRLLAAQAAWTRHEEQISESHPLTEGHAWSRERIQSVLEEGTAIIGWLDVEIGRNWKRAWGYVVRKDGPVRWIPLSPDDSAIEEYRKALLTASEWPVSVALGAGDIELARTIYDQRILPLLPFINDVQGLVVIPSGPMLGIPAEGLMDRTGQWLGDRFSVSYAPSGTVHGWLREKALRRPIPARGKALVLGDPIFSRSPQAGGPDIVAASADRSRLTPPPRSRSSHSAPGSLSGGLQPGLLFRSAVAGNRAALDALPRLPGTRSEATAVAGVFRKKSLLLGSDASEEALRALARGGALRDFSVLHFATHAIPDDARPEGSALVLSRDQLRDPVAAIVAGEPFQDGLLTAGEIVRDWKLDADLVTLSGCRTGLGCQAAGEGYLGLAHAFFQAGSRSLLVSLWDVEDRATALIMRRFYENLTGSYEGRRAGRRGSAMEKAEALREAKMWMRDLRDDTRSRPYEHPAFWSAFVLLGER